MDVLIERIDEETADELAATLDEEGFWGPAMPLPSTYEMLVELPTTKVVGFSVDSRSGLI